MQRTSDERIAERAAAGDREAFAELVRRWEGRVHRLAYGMLGDAEDARDAAQETFIAAFRNLASFRGEARVSTWLHRIAVNVCISRRRRAKVRPELTILDDAEAYVPLASDSSPARAAEQDERAEAVRRAVATLPPEFREVIVLKEFQEMTFAEIAETLGVPLSTVKSRLYTGLKQLRMKLDRFAPEQAREAAHR